MSQVIALVDDLMFLSRIREAARAAGLDVGVARDARSLTDSVRAGARLVLVDADSTRLPWADAVRSLRAASPAAVPVVAFVSHVNADRAEAARGAGCTRVVARGAFVQELPHLLAAAAAPVPEETER